MLVGDGKPIYTLRHPYSDAEAATRAATVKLEPLRRGNAILSPTLIGNPALQVECKIRLTGLRDPVDRVVAPAGRTPTRWPRFHHLHRSRNPQPLIPTAIQSDGRHRAVVVFLGGAMAPQEIGRWPARLGVPVIT